MSVLALRPSQIEGVDFLSTRRRAILADDTGLGKSLQSIRAADKVGARRILILCQAIGRVSWALEVPKWQTIPRQVVQYDKTTKEIPPGNVAVIAAFSTMSRREDLARLKKLLDKSNMFQGFDVLIIDEAHHLGGAKSARTKAVYGGTLDIAGGLIALIQPEHVWLLTATLQRGNATELFPHMRALFPHVLAKPFGYVPTLKDFTNRYCKTQETPYGTQIIGNDPDTIGELREAMRPYIMRRRKRDVAKELGEIQTITVPLEVDPKEVARVADENQASALSDFLDALDAGTADENIVPPNSAATWRALGTLKAEAAAEWAAEWLDNNPDEKLVVFAHHTDVLAVLHVALARYGVVKISGGTHPNDRGPLVHEFQTNPKTRVFLGQTIAAGTSITLTAASTVLMVEQEWTPADNYQAVSRVHRIGQIEPVTVYLAYAAKTLDERIAARAKRKADDFDTLFDPLTTT